MNDDQTLPYQAGVQSGGLYQTYNFGFHGYAPNQMLAEIESGRMRQVVDVRPKFAIYQALPDHVARVAGKIPYGRHNPRYELSNGTLRLNGHFDDGEKTPSYLALRLRGQLRKSAIYRWFATLEPRTNENDVQLLVAIVGRSRDLLAAQYPGIEFHVILWRNFDKDQNVYGELQRDFARMNIPVHLVDDIIPDYNANFEKYSLSPLDRHPNALADRMLANYVVTRILSRKAETPPQAAGGSGKDR